MPLQLPPFKGAHSVSTSTNCAKGGENPWYVTGAGDDTQGDFLRVAVERSLGPETASNQLEFPGPILAIHGALNDVSDTVIAKNLKTGNYEAYRVSTTCRQ